MTKVYSIRSKANNYIKGNVGKPIVGKSVAKKAVAKTVAKGMGGKILGKAIPAVGAAMGIMELKKNIPKIVSSVKEINKNYGYVRTSNKKSARMKGQLIDKVAKKEFIKERGEKNYRKATDTGALYNPEGNKLNKKYSETKKRYSNL